MNEFKYYVYTLTDPRNNHIFYVGKGTGNRSESHLKVSLRNGSNSDKYLKIKNIQDSGFKVQIDIIFPNLQENTAFAIEKIIVFKLGRQWQKSNGSLLNITPGGNWDPKINGLEYEKEYDVDFEISLQSEEIGNKILSIVKSQSIKRTEFPLAHGEKLNRPKGLTLEELITRKNQLLDNL